MTTVSSNSCAAMRHGENPDFAKQTFFSNFAVDQHRKNYNTMDKDIRRPDGQLKINLNPETARGNYSNLAMVGHSPNEFIIDYIFAAPGMPEAPVVSRIILAPETAKQLMFALTDNVQKYEARFGEIHQKQTGMPPIGNN